MEQKILDVRGGSFQRERLNGLSELLLHRASANLAPVTRTVTYTTSVSQLLEHDLILARANRIKARRWNENR